MRRFLTTTLILTVALFGVGRLASQASDPLSFWAEPDIALLQDQGSSNWSGYVAYGADGGFDSVRGAWTQPSTKCSSSSRQLSSHWVGIDGYGSETVQQVGTGALCDHGKVFYYAWYEFYPAPAKIIQNVSLKAGDELSAMVDSAAQRFTVTLKNLTTGESFSASKVMPEAARVSAEWITESANAGGAALPLANFGSVRFTNAVATVDGHTRAVDNEGWEHTPLYLINRSGDLRADTSALTQDGKSFKVTWTRH